MKKKHRFEFEIPEKKLRIETINGYKFYRMAENNFQCATCLEVTSSLAKDKWSIKRLGKVAKIKLVKDCDCPPQK